MWQNIKIITTLLAIILSFYTVNVNATSNVKVNPTELTAAILVAEAGGEGTTGMKAVMEVIRTRINQKHTSMYNIVTEKHAFSSFTKYHKNPQAFVNIYKKHKLFSNAMWIVNNYKGYSLTKGSNYYHEKTVHPNWSKGEVPSAIIGKHLFFTLIY